MGLDPARTAVWGPPHLEGGFEYIDKMLEIIKEDKALSSKPCLIVWDTITFCLSKAEVGNDIYQDGMMIKPRTLKRMLTRCLQALWGCNTHLLLVSQSYTSPTRFGSKIETAGGRAPKQLSTCRIELCRISKNTDDDADTYIQSKVTIVKNKIGVPFRKGVVRIDGNYGYNEVMSLAGWFMDNGDTDMIKQGGGWYTLCPGEPFEESCRYKTITEKAGPQILEKWREKIATKWPFPVDRAVNPVTGWVEPIEE
jgi:RecA/RadA recombinase